MGWDGGLFWGQFDNLNFFIWSFVNKISPRGMKHREILMMLFGLLDKFIFYMHDV